MRIIYKGSNISLNYEKKAILPKTSPYKLIAKYIFNSKTNTLPTFNDGFTYMYDDVDNGDGTTTRTIISDILPTSIYFGGKTELVGVSYLNTSKVTDMSYMFWNCYKLTSLNLSSFDTSKVTNMEGMFYDCTFLTSLNVSNWDTSNVTNMSYMFWNCYKLEHLDVFNWDVSNVTDMSYMFYCCSYLSELDVSKWDVGNVTNMELLFCNCCSLSQNTIDGLKNWDVSNVKYMSAMIDCLCMNDVTTIDLSGWDVSNVTDMSYMLEYNTELKYLNLNNWILNENVDTTELFVKSNNLEKVSIMNSNAFTINKIIAELPTREAESKGVLDITGVDDISQVDTTTAESKFWEFNFIADEEESLPYMVEYTVDNTCTYALNYVEAGYCVGLPNIRIQLEDGSTTNSYDKYEAIEITLLDGSTTTDATTTCNNVAKVKLWYPENTVQLSWWGYWSTTPQTAMITSVKYYNTSNFTDMSNMHQICRYLTSVDMSNCDTSNVTSMQYMFGGCHKLTSLDVSNFDTSKVTSMSYMFQNCIDLTSLDVSNFDTSNVTSMYTMFYGCRNLTSLDLSSFDTSKVTDMSDMFNDCRNLTSIDLSNWDISKVTDMSDMFYGCTNLTSINMNNSDVDSINDIINLLPTRTADSPGTLKIGSILASSCDVTTANSKYWNIDDDIVAIYTFNSSTDTLPVFNNGFTYTYTDVDNGDGTITRCIASDSSPSSINFNGKTGLVSVNYLDTSNVTDMSSMFWNCNKLTSIDLSSFNTSNVTNMNGMFCACTKLTSIDLSSFNTSNVTNMRWMFNDCIKLTSINLSNFNTSNVTTMSGMFSNCGNLNLVDMDNSDVDSINDIISLLPTRTADSMGTLKTGSIPASNCNIATASSKYWNIITQ